MTIEKLALAALAVGCAFCATATGAAAVDISKIDGLGGDGWTVQASTPEMVQLACTAAGCPASAQLNVVSRPAPDAARDRMVDDPERGLPGFRTGFEKSDITKICTISNYKADKVSETTARIELEGACQDGVVLMMAMTFDKRHPGSIGVMAWSSDKAQASEVRAKTVATVDRAIDGAK